MYEIFSQVISDEFFGGWRKENMVALVAANIYTTRAPHA
jgi:hypothetical protein